MKQYIRQMNKAFENRIRLGIMSVLMLEEEADFNTLKELLGTTDGNLASHLKALENQEMIAFRKRFAGRKPQTLYRATPEGREAFRKHLDALEKLTDTRS